MAIRDNIKGFLRVFGHALVASVHDRLTGLELRLDDVGLKLNQIQDQERQLSQQSVHTIRLLDEMSAEAKNFRAESQGLVSQLQDLAYSDAALLQGAIHLIETFRKFQEIHLGQTERIMRGLTDELVKTRAESEHAAGALTTALRTRLDEIENASKSQTELLRACLDHIDSSYVQGQQSVSHSRQAFDAVADLRDHVVAVLQNDVVQQVCIETSDYDLANPEVGLMSYLYSYLPNRRVIDVGAHTGEVSEALVRAGYEVYAFEPCPTVYQKLIARIGNGQDFHPFPIAIGSDEREMTLHLATDQSEANKYGDATLFSSLTLHSMPDDLPFTRSIPVSVQTLAKLHKSGTLPADIGLLKIDTEGFDLEVIRGMGEHRYPVVAAEFWDTAIPFGRSGLLYTLEDLVTEMKSRGYAWHIVLYRVWGRPQSAFYCNHPSSVPNSWGNVLFFTEFDLFAEAQKWCSAVLPRTYFKPVPAAAPSSGIP